MVDIPSDSKRHLNSRKMINSIVKVTTGAKEKRLDLIISLTKSEKASEFLSRHNLY